MGLLVKSVRLSQHNSPIFISFFTCKDKKWGGGKEKRKKKTFTKKKIYTKFDITQLQQIVSTRFNCIRSMDILTHKAKKKKTNPVLWVKRFQKAVSRSAQLKKKLTFCCQNYPKKKKSLKIMIFSYSLSSQFFIQIMSKKQLILPFFSPLKKISAKGKKAGSRTCRTGFFFLA